MSLHFINVDLEIESITSLESIVKEFKDHDHQPLYYGEFERGWIATFEVSSGGFYGNPDSVINRFADIIERFSPKAKKEWDASYTKVFDIGLEVSGDHFRCREELKPKTINLINQYGASVVFTVYPQEKV